MTDSKFLDLRIAHHPVRLWILAIIITVSSAYYQRMTGPTHPMRGKRTFQGMAITYKFPRSETVLNNVVIVVPMPDSTCSGFIKYRRYKSHDEWFLTPLEWKDRHLVGELPHQPPAGKLMYFVYVTKNGQSQSLTGDEVIILRYKGAVPHWILIPHILLMFLAMCWANRAGIEALDSRGNPYRLVVWTIGLFFVGGFMLGPLVQKYAFGELWTGIPLGWDLTDNKTLIAMLGWLLAWWTNRQGKPGRMWVVVAAVLMLAVYLIPHSVLGSEIDYRQLEPPVD